jgi:carbon monoxide dehydrogenase subunit G
MELRGTRAYQASPQAVWDSLHDPEILQASIPGAKYVTWDGPDKLVFQIEVGIGPVKGSGWGELKIVESNAPNHMKLDLNRQGEHNTAKGEIVVDLAPNGGGTQLSYSGSAVLGGPIAMLDNPLTRPLIEQAVDQAFSRLATQMR